MPTVQKAATLVEAMNLFDSRTPLAGETLEAFYVKRPDKALDTLKVHLQTKKPGKFLFTGPRGSGKSTELHRLIEEPGIRSQFFVVHFSVTDSLNPYNLNYVDLLLGLANQIFARATDEKILPKGVSRIIKEDLLDELYQWFTRDLLKEIPFREPAQDLSLTAKVNLLAIELEGKLSNEPHTRDLVRQRVEVRLNQLIDNINFVIGGIRQQINQKTLIIVEDIDKLDLKTGGDLYFQHAASLTAPKAHIIHTFPIALRYTNDFMQIRRNFDEDVFLPNIKIKSRDGSPYQEGRRLLQQIILERMATDLIDPAAVDRLVEMSGGVLTILIDLTQRAIVYALTRNNPKVEIEDVEPAIAKERADYQAVLTPAQLAVLRQRAGDKAMVNDELDRECLHNLSLLEYRNYDSWRDAHPIVWPLLEAFE